MKKSTITASVPALALYRLGSEYAAVYDGSWTEWGSRDDTHQATILTFATLRLPT